MSEAIKGVVLAYRKGPKTQKPKECLLRFPNIDTREEAAKLIGRKVAWPLAPKRCIGKILATHGKNGVVRARFRRGLPGQVLGTYVEIVG
ncbi:MAG: 50S ribosomal protein L35ae [Nitrososphaerota archaeon]|nr:50S ribosomal protein L35ae [Candidatus Bathyarchaeota archaeon]MDW8048738.1 50S ribosomal protein L35ae [Nitrososphaerota archaeon]